MFTFDLLFHLAITVSTCLLLNLYSIIYIISSLKFIVGILDALTTFLLLLLYLLDMLSLLILPY